MFLLKGLALLGFNNLAFNIHSGLQIDTDIVDLAKKYTFDKELVLNVVLSH